MADEQSTTSDAPPNDAHHDSSSESETPPENIKTIFKERKESQNNIIIENVRADLLFGTDNMYNAGGLRRSLHGTIYQLKLIMLFVIRAMNKGYEFCLASEINAAEKFDDIVLKYIKSGRKTLRFVQAKHKIDVDRNKITFKDLTSNNDNNDFSLQKYFISYCKIKHNILFKDADLQDFLIVTNIDFKQNEPTKKKVRRRYKRLETFKHLFEPISDLDEDDILHSFEAVKYKFKGSAMPILTEIFKRNLLDSAVKSRQIPVGSAIKEKLNSLRSLYFEELAHEATSQAAENIRNEYNHERRKGEIFAEAVNILRLKDNICKTEEFKDLKNAVDNLEKTPANGKTKNVTNLPIALENVRDKAQAVNILRLKDNICKTEEFKDLKNDVDNLEKTPANGKTKNVTDLPKALENVRDKAQAVSIKAHNDLKNSESILAKYKDETTDEFKRLDADKRKLSSDECQLRQLIEKISDAASLEPIRQEIYAKDSAGKKLESIFDENVELDALKDSLIKKIESMITDISIVQVAINDDTFGNCFEEFIEKFTIIAKFPIEIALGKHIVSELDGQFGILSADLVSDSFQREVLDFFKFYQDGKARGYTSTDAEKFFSNMRRQETMMRDKLIQLIDNNQLGRSFETKISNKNTKHFFECVTL